MNVPRPNCQTIYNTELLMSNLITYLPIRYVGKLWCLSNAHAQI